MELQYYLTVNYVFYDGSKVKYMSQTINAKLQYFVARDYQVLYSYLRTKV